MGEFKRKPGESLGLSLDLRPAPDETKYVRAFLVDKDGAPLTPSFVNLIDNGGGNFTENSLVMQSVVQMRAKYRVFLDSGYTEEDTCEYLGGEDVFDLDSLTAQQLPPDSSVTGVVQGQIVVEGEIKEEKVTGVTESEKLTGTVEDPDDFEAIDLSSSVSGNVNEEKIEGKIE